MIRNLTFTAGVSIFNPVDYMSSNLLDGNPYYCRLNRIVFSSDDSGATHTLAISITPVGTENHTDPLVRLEPFTFVQTNTASLTPSIMINEKIDLIAPGELMTFTASITPDTSIQAALDFSFVHGPSING